MKSKTRRKRPRIKRKSRPYVTYVAHDWSDLVRCIDKAKGAIKCTQSGEECFYRGHADHSWKLLPSLGREAVQRPIKDGELAKIEADLFWEFRVRAQELYGRVQNDWEYLFHMRHHGVMTRLLDWTESLSVALYFALDGKSGSENVHPCIWLLNPYALNAQSWDNRDLLHPRYLSESCDDMDYGDLVQCEGMPWEDPVAIYPEQSNRRMHAQRGWFTIFGYNLSPLEDIAPRTVAKIVLEATAARDAQEFLAYAGIDDYFVFQDLDGLASELHRKMNLSKVIKPMPKGSWRGS